MAPDLFLQRGGRKGNARQFTIAGTLARLDPCQNIRQDDRQAADLLQLHRCEHQRLADRGVIPLFFLPEPGDNPPLFNLGHGLTDHVLRCGTHPVQFRIVACHRHLNGFQAGLDRGTPAAMPCNDHQAARGFADQRRVDDPDGLDVQRQLALFRLIWGGFSGIFRVVEQGFRIDFAQFHGFYSVFSGRLS
ncbi:hypothetical protein GLUCOINTEAF2_0203951 [Komagataeibacter intermedius AF2]|uniref:Uncharacterized protein n=1 Tax=Komagataeibacter intermedius AF2 TaxID=1458464 RepID=A0A0N1FD44_9PROT|nr:hypothetical protein GLUCOINTEAF2_0203951 [Komagataeibacter intermedius AF2]